MATKTFLEFFSERILSERQSGADAGHLMVCHGLPERSIHCRILAVDFPPRGSRSERLPRLRSGMRRGHHALPPPHDGHVIPARLTPHHEPSMSRPYARRRPSSDFNGLTASTVCVCVTVPRSGLLDPSAASSHRHFKLERGSRAP